MNNLPQQAQEENRELNNLEQDDDDEQFTRTRITAKQWPIYKYRNKTVNN